jgi:surfactin synthase thioesterase subunit
VRSSSTLVRQKFWGAADDLRKFLKDRGLDASPYELIGYSLGGLLALQASSLNTLEPRRIVILALPLRIKLSFRFLWNELLTLFNRSFYRQWRAYGWRESIPAFGSFRRRSFPLRLDSRFHGSYPEMVDHLLQDQAPLALINASSHNYLLVFGKRDALASKNDIGQWQSASPNIKIVVIDRANHFLLPFQRQTIEAITSWIKS